jgi:hypothetical protein
MDAIDTKTILNEVETIKKVEDEIQLTSAVKSMIDKMKSVVEYYETTGNFGTKLYEATKSSISDYEKLVAPKLDKVNG